MYATVIKSMTTSGIRTVVIAPVVGGVKVFSRMGEGRGAGNAWSEGEVSIDPTEQLVGLPQSLMITPSEHKMLAVPIIPSMFLWKLSKTLQGVYITTGHKTQDVYNDIVSLMQTNPLAVGQYSPSPVQQPVVQAVATPVQLTPIEQPTPDVEETPMQYVTPQHHEADSPLTVPEFKPYVEREFEGLKESEIYDWARANQLNVLLTGDAGTGKTSSARNYAHIRNLPFVVIECTQQIDQSVTQGRYVPTAGREARWVDSQLVTIIQQPGVVLLNEMTRMSPKAAVLFLRLLEERELIIDTTNRVIKVHPDCIFIADQNTGSAYTGTSRQDGALVDRFNVKLEFKYDINIEKKFIDSPTLLQFANSIREASEATDEFSIPMSTRMLQNFQLQARGLGMGFAIQTLLNSFPKLDGERDAIKMRLEADLDTISAEFGIK